MAAVAANDVVHASEQERNELLQIVWALASQARAARGVCLQDEIEHRLTQFFCWAVPAMVWQRSAQAARMAVQSTALAGAVASSIRQAAMRTMYVVAFIPAPYSLCAIWSALPLIRVRTVSVLCKARRVLTMTRRFLRTNIERPRLPFVLLNTGRHWERHAGQERLEQACWDVPPSPVVGELAANQA